MDLREAYSATALASLEWSEERERAIDRVAAAGKASPLGINLWKAKYTNESAAYNKAIKELLVWYRERYTGEQPWLAERVVEQSLYEFIFQFCGDCGGAGEITVDELRVSCGSCRGSRLKRYSDKDRCSRMQISWALTKALTRKMQKTMERIFDEDRNVNAVMVAELRQG